MNIKTTGKYKFIKSYPIFRPHGTYLIHTGEVIEITAIDPVKGVYSEGLGGWVKNGLPVVEVEENK